MSKEVIDDWEQREFVSSIEDALIKIVDFLNRFDKSCRFKLASVNARLSGLERKLDYVQHCLSQADPQKRNGTLYSIKGTMFDMKHQLDDVRRRLEERNRQMRTQLPMLMEENANLKGVVSLQQAREEAANIRRQATKAILSDLPSTPVAATPPAASPAPAPAKQPTQPPVQKPPTQPANPPTQPAKPPTQPTQPPSAPTQAAPPRGPPSTTPARPPSALSPGGPPRGPPGAPASGGPPRGPGGPPGGPPRGPGGPPAGPGAPPPGLPGGGPPRPPGGPGGKPANWGRGENFQVHVTKQGRGPKPVDGQTCIIKYVGKLSGGPREGETFDESPPNYEFILGENIVGLEEALKTLSAGSEAKVWIPWSLAYGEEGAGDMIPPKTNLEFDLLLERLL